MHLLTPHIAIKHLEEQISKNDLKGSTSHSFEVNWWYCKANESMQKRIENYGLKQ